MQIIMPKLGLTMTHGTITEWLKQPGAAVKAGEILCTYETEKVTLELEAPEDGILADILAAVGAPTPVGTVVCMLETVSEGRAKIGHLNATPKARALAATLGVDLRQAAGRGPGGRIYAADLTPLPQPPLPAPENRLAMTGAPGSAGHCQKATPLARRIAAAEGIDLAAVTGTGPEGEIRRADVEQAVRKTQNAKRKSQITPAGHTAAQQDEGLSGTRHAPRTTQHVVIPLTGIRQVIAERMTASAFSAPHVTLMTEAEATNLVSARNQLNDELNCPPAAAEGKPGGAKIAYNTLLAALVARALREHPLLNSRLEADGIHLASEINIALAVDTERGLLTPVLRNVDRLSLQAIQTGYDALTARALAGQSRSEDFEAGTFTLTNLGSLEVDGFTPIINPPQAAILGIGRIIEKPVAREGAIVIRPMLTLSLSFDHRIVDGAPAGRFLQRIKQLVERPLALLV